MNGADSKSGSGDIGLKGIILTALITGATIIVADRLLTAGKIDKMVDQIETGNKDIKGVLDSMRELLIRIDERTQRLTLLEIQQKVASGLESHLTTTAGIISAVNPIGKTITVMTVDSGEEKIVSLVKINLPASNFRVGKAAIVIHEAKGKPIEARSIVFSP